MNECLTGTMDELEPALRSLGYTGVLTMAGPIDLAAIDPYGMRRVGSVNIQSEKWAHHVYRGRFVEKDGKAYLVDAKQAEPPFMTGLFELIRG
jgi:hypothetical protein